MKEGHPFPRTKIEGLSVSRLIVGTNWFLGYSHTSKAKDDQIVRDMNAGKMADILEVFLRAGVDTVMAPMTGSPPIHAELLRAIDDAQGRTGRKCILIGTPAMNLDKTAKALAENERTLDAQAAAGVSICMPHTSTTDALVNVRRRRIDEMDKFCKMIRRRGMIPGLSTHMPESIVYADESGLDVGTYISIYNAAGFLMNVEVDWVHRLIHNARHPVITIKPLAAGRLMPLVGLAFSWATIRDIDMVTIGTNCPDEAREVIDISLSLLSRRPVTLVLQRTRSKAAIERRK